ncbi:MULTISPECIES: hypothetical protein [Nocardiopsis]|uniref:Uncharacterized protein n=1 Tax=Nocardiopsis metallicus TaxID=179819 RepID=A0A840W7H2_9ACTN|nr:MULTISPECIES: hypothetical protein [Nocardiopsis]MBB5492959.1 hypothetical protein [Nocardiopsis metallicus]
MQNSSGGRHRKPRQTMASRLWWVFASAVAWALCQVIGAPTRTAPIRPQLPPAPRRLELAGSGRNSGEWGHPNEAAGALVRPYLLRG